MNEIIYKDPVSFDKNCSLLMRANSVLYQERRKIYYFSISPFSLTLIPQHYYKIFFLST